VSISLDADPGLALVAAGFSLTRDEGLAAFPATRLAAGFLAAFADFLDVLPAVVFTLLMSLSWPDNHSIDAKCQGTETSARE
jgi:hypothetical protein